MTLATLVLLLAAPPVAQYHVLAGDGARELQVDAQFDRLPTPELAFEDDCGRFVRDLQVATDPGFAPLALVGDSFSLAACASRGCHIRYRFELAEAARVLRNKNLVFEHEGALLGPAATWLVRPAAETAGRFRLQVDAPQPLSFVSGLFPGAVEGSYEADLADLTESPYSGFGPFQRQRIDVPGGVVEIAFGPGELGPSRESLAGWVAAAARATSGYFGRLPLPRVLVILLPGGRRAIGYGTTMGGGGASIMIWVGRTATQHDLDSDWVLTHEMTHLALPNLPRTHLWFEEGLATYVEPIARARAGTLPVAEMWKGLVEGLPRAGKASLDDAHGIGPLYWGGASFHFLADLEIRERTGNRKSLDDALRGILAAGGNMSVSWPLQRVLAEGDRATGVPVLQELYARLGARQHDIDLRALWRRLGVAVVGGEVRFDDQAPLAAIRRSITAPAHP